MISLVASCDLNGGIGYKNDLLVRLSNDMKYFKQVTTSGETNLMLMGRKTYESIGKPLPHRQNLILTHNKKFKAPVRCHVYHSIEDVLREYQNGEGKVNLWIIGGSEVYKQFIEYADRIYLTIIDHKFDKVDAVFPKFSLDEWKVVDNVENEADEKNPYDHHFVTYERRK